MRRAVAALLSRYRCADEVRRLETLAAYERPLRVRVLRAETAQGRFVVKLLARQAVSQAQEERQAAFSEFLRAQDLPVPQKFRAGDNFCSVLRLGRDVYLATVEEDFGEDLRRPTPETAYALGRFLGRMHSASFAADFQLTDGHTWRALMTGRTTAAQIWQGTPPLPELVALCQHHDVVCAAMRRLWPQLPRAAVHGDLSLTSNLMQRERGIGVIDFNLAGREMLLGDLLITWYSRRWQLPLCAALSPQQWTQLAQAYSAGYSSERVLTQQERAVLPQLAHSLNGAYCHRLIAALWQAAHREEACALLPHALRQYDRVAPDFDLTEVLSHACIQ